MSDFLHALDAEISKIEEELAADPRHARLRHLKEARKTYRPQGEDVSTAAAPPAPHQREKAQAAGRRVKPDREEKLAAVETMLGYDAPVPLMLIYGELLERGFEIGGKDPPSNLSAMLSYSGRFQSHGRRGWTRIRPAVQTFGEAFGGRILTPDGPLDIDQVTREANLGPVNGGPDGVI